MLYYILKIFTLFQKIPTFYLNIYKNPPKNDNHKNIFKKFETVLKYTLKNKNSTQNS